AYLCSLCSSPPHPALHSFPTRRSSDLAPSLAHCADESLNPVDPQQVLWHGASNFAGCLLHLAELGEVGARTPILSVMALNRRERSEEHTSELQSLRHLVCRLLLEKKNN